MERLDKGKKKADYLIVAVTFALVIFGVIMVFSASYYQTVNAGSSPYAYLIKDGIYACMGMALMLFFSGIEYSKYKAVAIPVIGIAIALLVLVLLIGDVRNGAQRWIDLKLFDLIPGEMAKPAIILFAAAVFAADEKRANDWKYIASFLALVGVMTVLILKQPNASTAATLALIAFAILFVAGISWKKIGSLAAVGIPAVVILFVKKGADYQMARVLSFLNPFESAGDEGYQVIQGLYALGSGGLIGQGLGNSIQKLLYIPEPHTDFILAVIGEETGFIGVFLLMVAYLVLIWRCIAVSVNAPDRFGMLLGSGISAMLALQVIFNIAIVTSSMPPTGVALPFVSYGGNSLMIFCTLMGVMINISRHGER